MYKVLIIDDSKRDINGLINHINWEKYNCVVVGTALNGLEGIELARETEPDIIVTDICMPLIDGIELTKKVNEILPEAEYIYISCFDDSEFLKSALDNDVVAYIYKPINIELFNEALNKVTLKLAEKERTDELNSMLSEQITLNRNYLIEEYVKDIIATGVVNLSRASLLRFDVNKGYCFVVVQLDDVDAIAYENTYVCYLQLVNLIKERFSSSDSYIVSYDWSKIIILADGKINPDDIAGMLNEIQVDFVKQSKYTFSAFIEPNIRTVDKLGKIFGSVNLIINQQYFQQKNQIIFLGSEFKEISLTPRMKFSDTVEKLKNYILTENYEQISGLISSYADEVNNCSILYVKALCFQFVSALNMVLIEQNESFSNIFGDELLLWRKLEKINGNMDAKQWLINIFNATAKYLNDKKTIDKYVSIANDIKQYIDENYAMYDLSDEISKKFYITFDYANKIFKKYYRQTIFKYVTDKKIKQAKVLLATTNKKITDIAQEVGYSTHAYFSVAFKKQTGVSPNEYREKTIKGKI